MNEVLTELRLGELRKAIRLAVTDEMARVVSAVPCYSNVLKLTMEARRLLLAVSLKEIANCLLSEADAFMEAPRLDGSNRLLGPHSVPDSDKETV